jgi:adenylate cyclase
VIEGELETATSAIVLWSPHSVGSHRVRGEARAALDLEKLAPIQIAECSPPINFRHLHTSQVFKSADQLSGLAKLLTDKLGGGHVPSSDPGPSRVLRLAPVSLMASPMVTRPCSRANATI